MNTRIRILCLGLPVVLAGALWAVEPGIDRPPPPPAGGPAPAGADAGGAGRKAGRDGAGGEFMQRLQRLKADNPAEFERLKALRENDPEAFRKEVREKFREGGVLGRGEGPAGRDGSDMRPRSIPEEEACIELSHKFNEAKDPADKEKLKTDLKAAIAVAFEKRLAAQRERIDKMEQSLKSIREQIVAREKNRDDVCKARLEELTKDPSLRWGDEPHGAPPPPPPPNPEER